MPGVQFSRSDVEHIARKLGTLRSHFTEDELTLLSAILAAASEAAVAPAGSAEAQVGTSGAPSGEVSYDVVTGTYTGTDASPGKIWGASPPGGDEPDSDAETPKGS